MLHICWLIILSLLLLAVMIAVTVVVYASVTIIHPSVLPGSSFSFKLDSSLGKEPYIISKFYFLS